MGGIAQQAFYKSVLKSLLSWLAERRLRERQNLFLSSCLLQQINKFGLKWKKKIEMSAYFKSRAFYSVHFPLAGLLRAVSFSLSNIFLTDVAYNGVNDKIEVADKPSWNQSNPRSTDKLFPNYTKYDCW